MKLNIVLTVVIALSIFGLSFIIHREFEKQKVFTKIRDKYKESRDKKKEAEDIFISKYGVIENRSLLYRLDRLMYLSGLKERFHLSAEGFVGILIAAGVISGIIAGNIGRNIFLSLFVSALTVTAIIIAVRVLYGRQYKRIEEDTSLFISILSNHAKSSSDIVTIMERTYPSMDGPIKVLIKRFLLDAEKEGNIDLAFDVMKESADNRVFQTIIVNLKNCMHFRANYEEVLQQMMNQVSESLSAREERKNILFSSRITVVSISALSVIIVLLIGKGIGVDVKSILTGNLIGQFILFITGLLYLFVTAKLFGIDK